MSERRVDGLILVGSVWTQEAGEEFLTVIGKRVPVMVLGGRSAPKRSTAYPATTGRASAPPSPTCPVRTTRTPCLRVIDTDTPSGRDKLAGFARRPARAPAWSLILSNPTAVSEAASGSPLNPEIGREFRCRRLRGRFDCRRDFAGFCPQKDRCARDRRRDRLQQPADPRMHLSEPLLGQFPCRGVVGAAVSNLVGAIEGKSVLIRPF